MVAYLHSCHVICCSPHNTCSHLPYVSHTHSTSQSWVLTHYMGISISRCTNGSQFTHFNLHLYMLTCKTVVCLLGSPHGEDPSWASDYVCSTCHVLPGSEHNKVLGVCPGAWEWVVSHVAHLHECVALVEDPGMELVLAQCCIDISCATYLLHCIGDSLTAVNLTAFDNSLQSALDFIVSRDLDDAGWEQATMGVPFGGLGFHQATDVALLAFLASHMATQPIAINIFAALEQANLAPPGHLAAAFD